MSLPSSQKVTHSGQDNYIPVRNAYIPGRKGIFHPDLFERSAVLHGDSTFDTDLPPPELLRLRPLMITMALGLLSLVLYIQLFHFDAELRELTLATNQGHKSYFLVPIGIAFLFSLVHGAFTDRFWDALGVKARKQETPWKQ